MELTGENVFDTDGDVRHEFHILYSALQNDRSMQKPLGNGFKLGDRRTERGTKHLTRPNLTKSNPSNTMKRSKTQDIEHAILKARTIRMQY